MIRLISQLFLIRPIRALLFSMMLLPLLLSGSGGLYPASAQPAELPQYESLRSALFSGGRLAGNSGPRSINWIEGGERYSYMQENAGTGETEIRVFDPATGQDEQVFTTGELSFPDSNIPFSFRSFQWSDDARFIIFQTNFEAIYRYSGLSDYYYYSIESGTLELVAERAFTAQLSPDGTKVAYHKDGNMFLYDLEESQTLQLTFDTTENVFYGRFGWVYEEEFGLVQAWKWSPDSQYIAFWKSDERDVPLFQTTNYEGKHPEWFTIPFPKVGDPNPSVEIGVIDIQTEEIRWMDLDPGEGYIPRIYWTARPGSLAITEMPRAQNQLNLHLYDVTTGSGERIMQETSDTWIDVFDFFAGIDDYLFFPQGEESFFWISDRDGWKHLYRYNYEGELLGQLTEGDWRVTYVHAIDVEDEQVYFSATEASPLERQLYRVGFDGSGRERITREPGRHRIDMGASGRFFINRYSNVDTPQQVELWDSRRGRISVLEDNAGVSEFVSKHAYAPRELFSFTTGAGHELDGYMIRPFEFDERRSYPLFLSIYGGPGAQGVYNEFETNMFHQYLAQLGYVVININNRGSGGYDREFEKGVYLELGHQEAEDYAAAARWMADTYEWIDEDRMAIRGHSYGGYMSALTMGLQPGVFQAAIIGAPVTDWRLYDTIYTERYMGLLEENRSGYERSSVMNHVGQIADDARLFIAHSAMDENVHLQNTMQLLTALTDAEKDAELRIYPKGNHSVAYSGESYVLLHQAYIDFLERHMKPDR